MNANIFRLNSVIALLALLVTVLLAAGCASRKSVSYGDMAEIAWNEDTVNTCQLVMFKTGAFTYVIPTGVGNRHRMYYTGKVYSASHKDTIYLCYKHNKVPPGFTSYLIRDVSGSYLIQKYTSKEERLFLRKVNISMPGR
ncbi:hypothetical protein HNQ91_002171 [Filimonas zeae]|uniref:Lipoprotein n=1 Tax=Filimonas zeae TaxID=1737353 RepID=A0A917MUR1_9BACT|nr:hypothetical protein [Filimonas zeae]MDR6339120.1 hypothetical protein [Filimonas zeae]GGH65021.1 hypothetical protein GCM10011379_17710 [Filimonas zeae]